MIDQRSQRGEIHKEPIAGPEADETYRCLRSPSTPLRDSAAGGTNPPNFPELPPHFANIRSRAQEAFNSLDTTKVSDDLGRLLTRYKAELPSHLQILSSLHQPAARVSVENPPSTVGEVLDALTSLEGFLEGMPGDVLTQLKSGPIKQFGGAKVSWTGGRPLPAYNGYEPLGSAYQMSKSLAIVGNCPSAEEVVKHIAEHGGLCDKFMTLVHERTHLDQIYGDERLRVILNTTIPGALGIIGVCGLVTANFLPAAWIPSIVTVGAAIASKFYLFRDKDAQPRYLLREVHAEEHAASAPAIAARMGIHGDKGRLLPDLDESSEFGQRMSDSFDTLRAL